MKEITLDVAQRIMFLGMLNQVKNDIETLGAAIEDAKGIALTEADKAEIGFGEVKNDEGQVVSFKWDKSVDKAVTLSQKTVDYVLGFINQKSEAKELTMADAPLLEIKKKLEA